MDKVRAKLLSDSPTNVSLQLDGWTAAHNGYMGSILGITVHYTLQWYILYFLLLQYLLYV